MGLDRADEAVRIRNGRDNFFTPIRLVLALFVMVGHAYAIGFGDPLREPQIFFHYTFSYLAVNLFFIASGFLVTKSMLYRGDGSGFAAARLLRIYPALIIHIAFILLVIGPIATSLPLWDYLSDPQTLMQPLMVLTFFETSMILPGVFESNGEPFASAPLWTLRYEMLCYFATLGAFALGLMRKRWMILAQFIVPSIIWVAGQTFGAFEHLPGTAESAVRFGIAYGLGAVFYAYQDKFRFGWEAVLVFLALCWLTQASATIEIAMNLFLGSVLMLLAFIRVPRLNGLQTLDDISYGIYIYHWGIMQLLFSWMPGLNVFQLFGLGLPVVVMLAWLSWTYVEKPMLTRKRAFGDWLRFGRKPVSTERRHVLLD